MTESATRAPHLSDGGRAQRGLGIWVLAAVSALTPFVAADVVNQQLTGGYTLEDCLFQFLTVFLAWFLLPVSIVLFGLLFKKRTQQATPVVVVLVCLIVLTGWEIRPQASTGAAHPESVAEGQQFLGYAVRGVLTALSPDHYTHPVFATNSCVDDFGRSRGASTVATDASITPPVTEQQLRDVAQQLQRLGWQPKLNSLPGQSNKVLGATRDGYIIDIQP